MARCFCAPLVSSAILVAVMAAYCLTTGGFTGKVRLGAINDALAIVVYGLALPVVPAMHRLLRDTGSARSLLLAAIDAVGIVVTMLLQWLLVAGVLTFDQQIAPVSIALLAVGTWIVGTGVLGTRHRSATASRTAIVDVLAPPDGLQGAPSKLADPLAWYAAS